LSAVAVEPQRRKYEGVAKVAEAVEAVVKRAVEAQRKLVESQLDREQRQKLTDLRNIRKLTGYEFEDLVARILRRIGYSAKRTPGSGDGGIDIEAISKEGERVVVQCKNHGDAVGPAAVRDLYGVLMHAKAAKGMLVGSGTFSRAARDFANQKPLDLVDGEKLLSWMRIAWTDLKTTESPSTAPDSQTDDDISRSRVVVLRCDGCGASNRVLHSRRKDSVCGRCRRELRSES
jgi:restriction endonuclease Mrr